MWRTTCLVLCSAAIVTITSESHWLRLSSGPTAHTDNPIAHCKSSVHTTRLVMVQWLDPSTDRLRSDLIGCYPFGMSYLLYSNSPITFIFDVWVDRPISPTIDCTAWHDIVFDISSKDIVEWNNFLRNTPYKLFIIHKGAYLASMSCVFRVLKEFTRSEPIQSLI